MNYSGCDPHGLAFPSGPELLNSLIQPRGDTSSFGRVVYMKTWAIDYRLGLQSCLSATTTADLV